MERIIYATDNIDTVIEDELDELFSFINDLTQEKFNYDPILKFIEIVLDKKKKYIESQINKVFKIFYTIEDTPDTEDRVYHIFKRCLSYPEFIHPSKNLLLAANHFLSHHKIEISSAAFLVMSSVESTLDKRITIWFNELIVPILFYRIQFPVLFY